MQSTVQTHLLNKYATKISQMAYHAKTAIIQGFLYDIRNKLDETAIAALGIQEDVAALEQSNTAFISAYNARATERAQGDTGVTVKLRQEMFALYQQICFSVQYLANTVDETLTEKAQACQEFIAVLNVILDDAKKRYLQRLANGTNEDAAGDEGGSTEGEGSEGGSQDSGSTSGSQ